MIDLIDLKEQKVYFYVSGEQYSCSLEKYITDLQERIKKEYLINLLNRYVIYKDLDFYKKRELIKFIENIVIKNKDLQIITTAINDELLKNNFKKCDLIDYDLIKKELENNINDLVFYKGGE